jgi:hypothetical protein
MGQEGPDRNLSSVQFGCNSAMYDAVPRVAAYPDHGESGVRENSTFSAGGCTECGWITTSRTKSSEAPPAVKEAFNKHQCAKPASRNPQRGQSRQKVTDAGCRDAERRCFVVFTLELVENVPALRS